jgi:hypothetical protein
MRDLVPGAPPSSQINGKRGTVGFKKKVVGVMAKHAASIACEWAGGK